MNLKKFAVLSFSVVLALASLFSLGLGGEANATGLTLYWCYPSNGTFSQASDWNTSPGACPGGSANTNAPANGDSLVFDDSITPNSSGIGATNDLSNLDFSTITFQGTGSGGYNIVQQSNTTSQAITVDSGITDSGNGGVTNEISAGVNLNGSQSISVTGSDKLVLAGNLNLGVSTATVSSGSSSITLSSLQGTGSLNFASPGSGVADYIVNSGNSSTFSGPVTINSKANVTDTSGSLNALGSGTLTVNSGGSLTLNSTSTSGTLANNLVLSGSGDGSSNYGALISCLGPSGCSSSTINITGSVTLNGNTQVVNGSYTPGNTPSSVATFNFSGKINYGGHTLTAVGNSSTVVNFPSSGSSGSSTKAPGSPDSGQGLVSSHSGLTLLGTVLISSGFVVIGIFSKRSKTNSLKK